LAFQDKNLVINNKVFIFFMIEVMAYCERAITINGNEIIIMKFLKKEDFVAIIEFQDDAKTLTEIGKYINPVRVDYNDPENPMLVTVQNGVTVCVPKNAIITVSDRELLVMQ
jgi:hypothetical protein